MKSQDWNKSGEEEWRAAPGDSGEAFRSPNSPVVDVNWFEAVGFCRWLSPRLGFTVGLPSEAEWERAARHTVGRVYPWGNATDDVPQRCNIGETGIGLPSAVGRFPSGAAECGALDLAGNVREGCRTKHREDYQDYEQKVDDSLAGADVRGLRGGSWNNHANNARCADCNRNEPDNPNHNLAAATTDWPRRGQT